MKMIGSDFNSLKIKEAISMKSKKMNYIKWFLRILAVAIMGQTLFFKFSGAEESIYIFTRVGMEPWGRYGTATIELLSCILILWPRFSWLGSFMSATVMLGAVFSHLTLLGIVVQDDQGLLFALACVVFLTSLVNLFFEREKIPFVGHLLLDNNLKKQFGDFRNKNIKLGFLFLAICVLITVIGIAQQVYVIDQIVSLNSAFAAQVSGIAQTAYFLTIAGILLAFFLAMSLLRLVGQPISKLTEVCRMIVSGDHSARAEINRVSEIKVMADSFNHMLDELQRKDSNIKSLLNGIPSAVFFFDANGEISKEKSLATDLIFSELKNQTNIKQFYNYYSGSHSEDIQELITLFWNDEQLISFDSLSAMLPKNIVIEKNDKSKKYIELDYQSEKNQNDKLSRVIVIGADKTNEVLSALESKSKTEFVQRISFVGQNLSDYLTVFSDLDQLWNNNIKQLNKK